VTVVRLLLAYDGTGFHGWARQPRVRTVQGVVEDALARFLGERPVLSVAGRTDAGVHAAGQVASFVWPSPVDVDRVQRALNGMLGPEVACLRATRAADGFDARRSATAREYVYRIHTGAAADPFRSRYEWHRPERLALAPMRAAARHLVGAHDFRSFCRLPPDGGATTRTLRTLSASAAGERLEIRAVADSFLHQMVRSLTGTLVAAGSGRLDPGEVPRILEARRRDAAAQMAPPHGLTLMRVRYRANG
jgi:tRNA pseudouridine38-40 synthase